MKNVIYVYCLIAISFIFTACSGYPHVIDKNQYVHLFYLHNQTTGDLVLLQETKSGVTGEGAPSDYFIFTEAIVNYNEIVPENTLLSLSQVIKGKLMGVSLSLTYHDEDGNVLSINTCHFTEEMNDSPFWSNNYVSMPADLVDDYIVRSYQDRVVDGHVKVYVLPVTEEYLEQLEARE